MNIQSVSDVLSLVSNNQNMKRRTRLLNTAKFYSLKSDDIQASHDYDQALSKKSIIYLENFPSHQASDDYGQALSKKKNILFSKFSLVVRVISFFYWYFNTYPKKQFFSV